MTLKTGSWCLRCGKSDEEPAGAECRNPNWHIPNANAPRPEPAAGVRLPYVEDRE